MDKIILDGKSLTIQQVIDISDRNVAVEISGKAYDRCKKSCEILFKFSNEGYPVYGLNRGVGWNKDRNVYPEFFDEYNKRLLRSHSSGVEPLSTVKEVRAMMAIRLNTVLCGSTGMSRELIDYYVTFINEDIIPVVPKRGSVGEADITTLSHIGLSMIGENDVFYKGKRMEAIKAIKEVGLKSLVLGPKDGLSIVSSSAHSAATACILINEVKELIKISNIIYCLSLEGLNGNIEPLDINVNKARGYEKQLYCAKQCLDNLRGSYLYDINVDKALQDSLSYRGCIAVNGAVLESLNYLEEKLLIQLNNSDDNPCILPDEERISVSCNYETITWVVAVEMLSIALNHLSKTVCHRILKLSDPIFTKLGRFLSSDDGKEVIAFGTAQKAFTSLDSENRMLANPSSMDYIALAGHIEDHANNSPLAVEKALKIVDNLRYIIGIEAIHSAQAIDLRDVKKLGKRTKIAYETIRNSISFLDSDRNLSIDIKKAYDLIKEGIITKNVEKEL